MSLSKIDILSIGFLLIMFVFPNVGSFISPPTDDDTVTVLTDQGFESIKHGNLFVQIGSIALCGITLLFVRFSTLIRTVIRHRLAVLYFCFLLASLTYTLSPELTLRRLALFAIIVLFGFAQAQQRCSSIDRLLKTIYVFGLTYVVIVIVGLLRSLLSGHQFFFSRFSLFGQAYTDAEILALTLLLHWYFQKDRKVKMTRFFRTVPWLILPLGVVLTLSRTAIACLVAAGTYILIRRTGKRRQKVLGFFAVASALVGIFLLTPNSVIHGVFRPETIETLTGRTILWDFLLDSVSGHPFWGAGFGAYWSETNILWVQLFHGWAAPGAHNGFLDVFLNTGIVGLAFVLAIIANAWQSSSACQGDTRTLLRAMIIYVLVQNVTQGSFQSPKVFVEVIFWWVYVQIVETKIRAAQQAKPVPAFVAIPLRFVS